MIKALAALACAGAAASMASASATFTFDDPTGGNEVSVTGGVVSYDENAIVTLTVDATEGGGLLTTFDANLSLDFTLGAPVQFGVTTFAPVSGTFAWTEATTGQSILSGSFDSGQFFIFANAGAVVASGAIDMGALSYTPGELLVPPSQLIDSLPAVDASWTLTNVVVDNGGNLITTDGSGNPVVNDFTANTAFAGTALVTIVPAPGAVALFACGIGVAARRRR